MKQRVDKLSLDGSPLNCLIIEDFNPYTTTIGLTSHGLNDIQYITICDVLKSGIDVSLYNENGTFVLEKVDDDTMSLLTSYDQKKIKMAEDMITKWAATLVHKQMKFFKLDYF